MNLEKNCKNSTLHINSITHFGLEYLRLESNYLCIGFRTFIDSINWDRCWSCIPTSKRYIYTCRRFGKSKKKILIQLHYYVVWYYYVTMSRVGLEWCWISWFGMWQINYFTLSIYFYKKIYHLVRCNIEGANTNTKFRCSCLFRFDIE